MMNLVKNMLDRPVTPDCLAFVADDLVSDRPFAARFLAQPERVHERDLGPAVGRFALHRSCPEVGDGRCTVRILGVEIDQLLFGLLLDLFPDPPQFLGQFRSVAWDVLQHDFKNETGHRVEVTGKGLTAQT